MCGCALNFTINISKIPQLDLPGTCSPWKMSFQLLLFQPSRHLHCLPSSQLAFQKWSIVAQESLREIISMHVRMAIRSLGERMYIVYKKPSCLKSRTITNSHIEMAKSACLASSLFLTCPALTLPPVPKARHHQDPAGDDSSALTLMPHHSANTSDRTHRKRRRKTKDRTDGCYQVPRASQKQDRPRSEGRDVEVWRRRLNPSPIPGTCGCSSLGKIMKIQCQAILLRTRRISTEDLWTSAVSSALFETPAGCQSCP